MRGRGIGFQPVRDATGPAVKADRQDACPSLISRHHDATFFAELRRCRSRRWDTPFVHHGFAYWVNRVGVVYCIDVVTGEQKYAQRTKQSCWATPLALGDRICFFGKDGITTVIAAGPEYKELAANELWPADTPPADNGVPKADETSVERKQASAMFSGPTQYGVAAVSGSLLIRIGSQVYCV